MNSTDSEIREELANWGFDNLSTDQFEEFKRQLFTFIDSETRQRTKSLCNEHDERENKVQNITFSDSFCEEQIHSNDSDDEDDLEKSYIGGEEENLLLYNDESQKDMSSIAIYRVESDANVDTKELEPLDDTLTFFNVPLKGISVDQTNSAYMSKGGIDASANNQKTNYQKHADTDEILEFKPKDKTAMNGSHNSEKSGRNSRHQSGIQTPVGKEGGSGYQTPAGKLDKSGTHTPVGKIEIPLKNQSLAKSTISKNKSLAESTIMKNKKLSNITSISNKSKPEETYDHNIYDTKHYNNGDSASRIKRSTCLYRSSNINRVDESIPKACLGGAFEVYETAKNTYGCTDPSRRKKIRSLNKGLKGSRDHLPPHYRRPKQPSAEYLMKKYYFKFWNAFRAPGEESDSLHAVRHAVKVKLNKRFEITKEAKAYVPNFFKMPHEMDRRDLCNEIKAAHQRYEMPKHGYYHPIVDDTSNRRTTDLFW